MGFRADSSAGADWAIDLDSQTAIPDELLFRFNADVLILEPLTVEEFAERITLIRKELNLTALPKTKLTALARQASASGKHNRWLEAYLSRIARDTIKPNSFVFK